MMHSFTLRTCILLAGLSGTLAQADVYTANAMSKFVRDQAITGAFAPVELDAMRNEHEAFQVVFRAEAAAIAGAKVSVTELTSEAGTRIDSANIRLRLAHYMFCNQAVKVEAWWPDALLPYASTPFEVAAGQNQSVFVDCYVPADTPPGIYRGKILAEADGKTTSTDLRVKVRNLTLPVAPTFHSAFAVWGGQHTAIYPGMSAADDQKLMEKLYWFFTDYRLPPDDLPVPLDSAAADRYLNDPKVGNFRIPYDPVKPDEFVRICKVLRDKKILNRAYVYTLDEPAPEKFAECMAYADTLHSLAPDVRFLLTINGGGSAGLDKHVNIWCPVLNDFNYDYSRAWQKSGNESWWYTAVYPKSPYPTYDIVDEGLSPRMMSWLQAKYQVTGVLYWAVNIWKKYDEQRKVFEPRDVWTECAAWPGGNGDGVLVYPAASPQDEPIPSWRLEMIRQGNEDFDMLTMLKDASQKAAAKLGIEGYDGNERVYELVSRIGRSLVLFDHDPAAMEQLRRDVLDELESLNHGPAAILRSSVVEGTVPASTQIAYRLNVEPGSKVEVTAVADGATAAITPVETDGLHTWPLTVTAPTVMNVRVMHGERIATFTRYYKPVLNASGVEPRPVFSWQQPDAAMQFKLKNVELFPVAGSVLQGFRFDTTTEFPSARIRLDGDTSAYEWIEAVVSNPSNDPVFANLKAHGPASKLDCGQIQVPPRGRVTLAFPFNPAKTAAATAFDEVEIWMWKGKKANSLVIESLTLYPYMPNGDNIK